MADWRKFRTGKRRVVRAQVRVVGRCVLIVKCERTWALRLSGRESDAGRWPRRRSRVGARGPSNTTNYNLDSNWGPATSPVAAGNPRFQNTEKNNVNVTAGSDLTGLPGSSNATRSLFTSAAHNVNFQPWRGRTAGIINRQYRPDITISNNTAKRLPESGSATGNNTLILSGSTSITGNTTISAVPCRSPTTVSVGNANVVLNGGTFQADGVTDLKVQHRFRMNAAGGRIDANGRR